MTLFFKEAVSGFFPEPCVGDDLVFRELLVTVWNQILLRLENGKPGSRDVEEIGFMLRRVYVVATAYSLKKKTYPIAEWVKNVVDIAKGAGIPVPGV